MICGSKENVVRLMLLMLEYLFIESTQNLIDYKKKETKWTASYVYIPGNILVTDLLRTKQTAQGTSWLWTVGMLLYVYVSYSAPYT